MNNKLKNIFKIGKITIGDNFKPIIICEIGINHNGSLKIAKKMVDAAKKSGAEIIKHQTHIPDDEMSNEAKNIIPKHTKKSIFDIIKKCALNEKDELNLKKYVEKKGMIFISTPFSKKAVDRLVKFKVKAFKIGSGECNNIPLIEYICSKKKPIILSTGMNNLKQVKKTVKILNNFKINYAILHTTNLYPTPHKFVRLGAMEDLMKNFPNTVCGLSDHTTDNFSSYFAIGKGAKIIEKHFTDSKKRNGPDISCSMDPIDLKNLLNACKLYHIMNNGKKTLLKEEKSTSNFAFASVVAIKNIKKGTKLSKRNLWIKRPGNGDFKASDLKKLYGKIAKKLIKSGDQIKKRNLLI